MRQPAAFDIPAALDAQARLRFWWIGAGCVLVWMSLMDIQGAPMPMFYAVAGVHLIYATACLILARRLPPGAALPTAYATAALDPFMLTMWLLVLGEQGLLMAGLYLFTAIGYGMRIGRKAVMHVCQVASLIAFSIALAWAPYWQAHTLVWFSYAASILVIPIYAGVLMDRLSEALRFADRESRAKSELLARVSHELRTPLGGISNAAEIIKGEAASERHQQLAATVLTLSGHLLAEINELLDQSKLDADSVRLAAAPIEITSVIDTVRGSIAAQAAKKGIGFNVSLDPRITDRVVGDSHYLARILLNLTGNAVKFTDFGHVTLHIALLAQDEAEYVVRFSIQDTGIGIPKDFQQKIFDPFVQVETGSSRRYDGTGLGLAIAKQIVQLMGGSLSVRSEPGKGSTFWFDLRMVRVAAVPQAAATPAPAVGPATPRNILVVDDNETNLDLLRELLETLGHRVITATSGQQALEVLASNTALDMLLLDYNLGDIDGAAVLQTYRFGRIRPAPAFFLTADASTLTAERLKATGALGVLTKPVRAEELRKAISSIDGQPQQATAYQSRSPAAKSPAADPARPHVVPVVYLDSSVLDNLRKIGSRPGFISELLGRASADIAANCARIADALGAKDAAAAREAAHALKGVCLEVGATRLMNLAVGMMRYEDHWLLTSSGRLIGELSDTAEKTRAALRSAAAVPGTAAVGRSAA